MKRIYVAGAYSGPDVLTVLENMRKGMRLSTEVMLAGHCPFAPWFDYQFALLLREGEKLSLQNYYDYSMAWLEVSDAVLLVPGWEQSKGTLKELDRAYAMGMPVYHSLEELKKALS